MTRSTPKRYVATMRLRRRAAAAALGAVLWGVITAEAAGAEGGVRLAERVVVVAKATSAGLELHGTGFRLGRPDVVMTAKHVASNCRDDCFVIFDKGDGRGLSSFEHVGRIVVPPDSGADLAALILRDAGAWETFNLAPRPDFLLGMPVGSFGYPEDTRPGKVEPRMLIGHIQRIMGHETDSYRYVAYELGFPAFPGQSGSPVFSDRGRDNVVAVVTQSKMRSRSVPAASSSWTIGISLYPFEDWKQSILSYDAEANRNALCCPLPVE